MTLQQHVLSVNDAAVLGGNGISAAHYIIDGSRGVHLGFSHWLSWRLQLLL